MKPDSLMSADNPPNPSEHKAHPKLLGSSDSLILDTLKHPENPSDAAG